MQLHAIAYARNGFSQKFGIPRQSREDSCIETRIVFCSEYRVREALRGIEDYSHLWLLWGFSEVHKCESVEENISTPQTSEMIQHSETTKTLSWSPTVRPPRLGGNKRMGVFATRSPFRPNPIGLSSVKLLRLEDTLNDGLVLVVSGADLLDGTPIYDIKPYLTFSDSHPEAKSGFAEATKDYCLSVQVADNVLNTALQKECPWEAIREILMQDPRPAYQDNSERIYYVTYAGWEVAFSVDVTNVCVKDLRKI